MLRDVVNPRGRDPRQRRHLGHAKDEDSSRRVPNAGKNWFLLEAHDWGITNILGNVTV